MHDSTEATNARPSRCPFCEVGEIRQHDHNPEPCSSCGALPGHEILEALRQIMELPDAVGRHACECGHPEMRRLPDGVRHCPACGSEVLPIESYVSDARDRAEMDRKLGVGEGRTA